MKIVWPDALFPMLFLFKAWFFMTTLFINVSWIGLRNDSWEFILFFIVASTLYAKFYRISIEYYESIHDYGETS